MASLLDGIDISLVVEKLDTSISWQQRHDCRCQGVVRNWALYHGISSVGRDVMDLPRHLDHVHIKSRTREPKGYDNGLFALMLPISSSCTDDDVAQRPRHVDCMDRGSTGFRKSEFITLLRVGDSRAEKNSPTACSVQTFSVNVGRILISVPQRLQ